MHETDLGDAKASLVTKRGRRTVQPRFLKPFRSFLPERLRRRIRQATSFGKALKEESSEGNITDAVALVLDSTSTNDEREKAAHGFIKELSAMRGDQIVAIADVAQGPGSIHRRTIRRVVLCSATAGTTERAA